MASTPRWESDNVDPSPLGEPLKFAFSGKTAPTRFLKAAMSERLATWDPKDHFKRGVPTPNLINVYRRWGEGGFGIILSGNIMLFPDQLETMGNTIIPADADFTGERFEAFKEMATVAKAQGSLFVGQVSHPGRQTEQRLQKDPVSASDVQLEGEVMGMHFAKPHPASQAEIDNIVKAFGHAAEYLERAGFDGIELHGAHGYLLAQFLSQSTNRRTDGYGGSLENRARIILDVAREVRRRTKPDFVLGMKLNSKEFQDNGFTPAEAKELCALLDEYHFDFVELTGGTYESLGWTHERESTKKREAFFLEFADTITPSLKRTKSFITGGFLTAGAMVKALDVVDGVGLGRAVCQEFQLPKLILQGKVTGSIKQTIDRNDFGASLVAAGVQIKQVGKDHEPIDLSQEENTKVFFADLGAHMENLKKDTEMIAYGNADITSVAPTPYVMHT